MGRRRLASCRCVGCGRRPRSPTTRFGWMAGVVLGASRPMQTQNGAGRASLAEAGCARRQRTLPCQRRLPFRHSSRPRLLRQRSRRESARTEARWSPFPARSCRPDTSASPGSSIGASKPNSRGGRTCTRSGKGSGREGRHTMSQHRTRVRSWVVPEHRERSRSSRAEALTWLQPAAARVPSKWSNRNSLSRARPAQQPPSGLP